MVAKRRRSTKQKQNISDCGRVPFGAPSLPGFGRSPGWESTGPTVSAFFAQPCVPWIMLQWMTMFVLSPLVATARGTQLASFLERQIECTSKNY